MQVAFDDYFSYNSQHNNIGYFRKLKYYDLVKSFQDVFGKENVHVLLFEKFVQERYEFLAELNNVLGVSQINIRKEDIDKKINESQSERYIKYSRIRSKIPIKSIRNLLPFPESIFDYAEQYLSSGKKSKITLNNQQIESIQSIYSDQNKLVDEILDLNLQEYGYPM